MATATASAPVIDPAATQAKLRQRLNALRRRIHLVTIVRGSSWIAALLLAVFVFGGLIDFLYPLPRVIRALFLVGGLGGAGYLFYRYLYLPLKAKDDDLSLALRIEDRYPGLNDSLASSVQFLAADGNGDSPLIRREAVRRALRGIEKCDFSRVVDARWLRTSAALALLGVLTVVGLGVWRPALAGTGFLRFAVPFGEHEWPSKTVITLDNVRDRIGRNEAFEVSGQISGVIPTEALVVFKLDGVTPTEHKVELITNEGGKTASFRTRLDPGRVQRDFLFQARANDAVTPWRQVSVLPPPMLVPLNGRASPQLHLQFPGYTDLPEQDLPDGSGNIEAVAGTAVTLRAAANRPLESAWIEFLPEPYNNDISVTGTALGFAWLGTTQPVAVLTLLSAGQEVWGKVPADLGPDRCEIHAKFHPHLSGMYALHFVDQTGLPGTPRKFELRVFPDPAPIVTLERPSPIHDSLTVTPDAKITLQAVIEDPQFAVRSAYLEYRCKKSDPPRRLPLYSADEAGAGLASGVSFLTGSPHDPLRIRSKRVAIFRKLALSEFRHLNPDEGALGENDILTLQVCADDFDDVSVDKQPGRSHEIEIHIKSRNFLEAKLDQWMQDVQTRVVELRKLEQDAEKRIDEVQRHLKENGKLSPEDIAKLVEAEELQKQIHERLGDRPDVGLRAELQRIQDTIQENPQTRSGARQRMEDVAKELERLVREELPQIETRLENARKQAERPDSRETAKDRAARLEEEAKEKERLALEKEKLAQEHEKAAQDKRKDSPERLEEEKKAAEERNEAQADREQAKNLHQQAEEARKQPDNAKPENGAREQLQEARQHQDEVEKTFSDLLKRLEPWTSTQELKGETKNLLEEQRRLERLTEELFEKQNKPSTPEEAQEVKDAAQNLRAEQQRLQEREKELLEKMKRVADEREKNGDAKSAKELRDAIEQARKENLDGHMKEAEKDLAEENPKLAEAAREQAESAKALDNLAQQLENRRGAEMDRSLRNLEKEEKELARLQEDLERLRRKEKEADKIADPDKRKEELKRLAKEEKELQQKAEDMAARMGRERNARGAQAMQQAAAQIKKSVEKLERDKPEVPEQENQEALDRLNEARREVAQAREQAEDELAREQLAKVADEIKRVRERQEGINAQTERVVRELQQAKEKRAVLGRLGEIAGAQGMEGLAQETAGLAEKKLDSAPVFGKALRKISDLMDEASLKMLEHRDAIKDNENGDSPAGPEALSRQKEILRRLDQMLQAVKEEQGHMEPGGRPDDGGENPGGGGGGGGGAEGDGIPPLAQLKLLRQLQADINARTVEFRKAHPDADKLDDKAKTELQGIRKEQQELADLLEELIQPDDPPADKPPQGDKPAPGEKPPQGDKP